MRAQLSLEYLLLLAAAASIFAGLVSLLDASYQASLFGLDSANAKSFAFSLQESVNEVSFQADGSVRELEANPFLPWGLSSNGNELFLTVKGPGDRQKAFSVLFPNKPGIEPSTLGKSTPFLLKKSQGLVLLEYG